MKKPLLTLLVVTCASGLFAQGTVSFNNRNKAANLFAPIYGFEIEPTIAKTGQSAIGLPSGTQTYTGPLLTGSGWTAQLWAAPGANALESALQPASTGASTFRTGASSGAFAATTATLTGVPKDAAVATVQVRVWNNMGGTVTSWSQAQTSSIGVGKSTLWNINAIGGDINTPPGLDGMSSFHVVPIPGPSTLVLAGLGAVGLLVLRWRK